MSRILSFCFSVLILISSVSAWSEIPLELPGNPTQMIDFMVSETGVFAGYPLLLCKIDEMTYLFWLSDPVNPVIIGQFVNKYSGNNSLHHRLTVDAVGNPIVVEISWGRCSVLIHESGSWHSKQPIPISGSKHCIGWLSPGVLLIDYTMGYDLYRASVDTISWSTDVAMIKDGYSYTSSNLPFWSYTEELMYYPASVFIYLTAKSRSDYDAHAGLWFREMREVSLIPESRYEASGMSPPPIGLGHLFADWLSDENWVAMYQLGDEPYKIKSAQSEIVALGQITVADVVALANGMQYAAWADSAGTMYLMSSLENTWLQAEPIFSASPDSIFLVVADNNWILFHDDLGWRLLSENAVSGTPTPIPDPPPTFTPGSEKSLLEIHISRRMFHPYEEFRCALWIQNPHDQILDGMPVFVLLEVGDTLFFGPEFGTTPQNYLDMIPSIPYDHSAYQIIDRFKWPEGVGNMSGVRLIAAMTDPEVTQIVSNIDVVEFGWTSSY